MLMRGWGIRWLPCLLSAGILLGTQFAAGAQNPFVSQGPVISAKGGDDKVDLDALRTAILDLSKRFPDAYPLGKSYLQRLDGYEKRPENIEEIRSFQREALLANPLVSGQPILFVERPQYLSDHHNTATLFQANEINAGSFRGGSALKMINFAQGGAVTTLLSSKEGMIRDPEVHFSGDRIVFSMRKDASDDYHIYEINADGGGLRQRTAAPKVSDIDPLYLADDHIAFSSTREPKYCMCNRHIMANLYRMEPDGANIHQIGKSTLFEGHGTLMPDGRILYYRWEYIDRNFGDAQALWTVNPDGTNHAVYWGNNTSSPGAVIDARPIPGAQQVLCIFGSCHDRPWGAVALLDRRAGLDKHAGVVRTWPANAVELIGQGDFDTFKKVQPKYEDPYPLDDTYFLCSRMTGRDEQMGIYLLDRFGNEILLHSEGKGCYDPMPLAPRPRPAAVPERRDYENKSGALYVVDVYQGTHMTGVKRGAVKALRVVESPEKRSWTQPSWNGQGQAAPAMNWHDFNNKRILGTVPVYPDGSAHFTVPSDAFVYFQLLDERGMMVQSMRSGAVVQSGEITGCVGCHEDRRSAPLPLPAQEKPLALQHPPSPLDGWYGPARTFNFRTEVQPVLDAHCVSCHDYGDARGGLNLSGDRDLTFNTAYTELWRLGMVSVPGAGPASTLDAYSWGAHASRLTKALQSDHYGVTLDEESYARIVTWMDINAPYYPEYTSAYPDTLSGRSPLSNAQLSRLEELTQTPLAKFADFRTNPGPQVNFDRPALSPCLQKIAADDEAAYTEALSIIQEGALALARHPRADDPGFVACDTDLQRDRDYLASRLREHANRRAIREGDRMYETIAPPYLSSREPEESDGH